MTSKDLIASAAQIILLVIFTIAGSMKLLNAVGYAPAGYTKHALEAFPQIMKAWFIAMTRIPAHAFFPLVGIAEISAAVYQFWKPRRAAMALALLLVGIEITMHSVTGFSSPMCSNPPATSCAASIGAHLFLFALCVFVYLNGEPLCRQVMNALSSVQGAGPRSPRATKNPYATRNRAKKD